MINKFKGALMGATVLGLSFTSSWAQEDKSMSKLDADLIVKGRYIVTMNKDNQVIEDGAIAIKDSKIIAVDKSADIEAHYKADQVIDGGDRAVMPGFINGHAHSAMTLFRGLADDYELMTWLQNYIFPMEGRFVDAEFVEIGMELACWEMIAGGTTTFVDMYFHPEVSAKVVEKCGLRATIGSASIDFPSPGFEGWDDSFAYAVKFVQDYKDFSPRITPAFAPHAPYTVSPEHLKQVTEAALKYDAPVTMHVAEDRSELTFVKENYNSTPVKHIETTGILETKLITAHMVHPNEEEMKLLAQLCGCISRNEEYSPYKHHT